jgi:hypothetical protein
MHQLGFRQLISHNVTVRALRYRFCEIITTKLQKRFNLNWLMTLKVALQIFKLGLIQGGPKVTSLVARQARSTFASWRALHDAHRTRILCGAFTWHMRQIHETFAQHSRNICVRTAHPRITSANPTQTLCAPRTLLLDPSVRHRKRGYTTMFGVKIGRNVNIEARGLETHGRERVNHVTSRASESRVWCFE